MIAHPYMVPDLYNKCTKLRKSYIYQFEGAPMRNVPFFVPLLDGIEREADRREIDLSLHIFRNNRVPLFIREGLVDGVICFHTDDDHIGQAREQGLPMVMVGQRHEGIASLHPDDFEGIALATRHLVAAGHRRIGYIGHRLDFETSFERLRGYRAVLEAAGLPVQRELIEANLLHPNADAGSAAVERLLARTRDFTAIVCYNDTIAMGAIRALRAAGLRVPEDISVTGFDDVTEDYNFSPAVTSIRFDGQGMGRRAVELMEHQITRRNEGDERIEIPPRESFSVHLVERDSTRSRRG